MDLSDYSPEELRRNFFAAYVYSLNRFFGHDEFCRARLLYLHGWNRVSNGVLPSNPAERLEIAEQMRECPLWLEANSDDKLDVVVAELMLYEVETYRISALESLGLSIVAKEARSLRAEHLKEAVALFGGINLRSESTDVTNSAGHGVEDNASSDADLSDER